MRSFKPMEKRHAQRNALKLIFMKWIRHPYSLLVESRRPVPQVNLAGCLTRVFTVNIHVHVHVSHVAWKQLEYGRSFRQCVLCMIDDTDWYTVHGGMYTWICTCLYVCSACRLQGLAARADGLDTGTCTVCGWAGAMLVPCLYPNKGYISQSVTSDLQVRGRAGRPAGAAQLASRAQAALRRQRMVRMRIMHRCQSAGEFTAMNWWMFTKFWGIFQSVLEILHETERRPD